MVKANKYHLLLVLAVAMLLACNQRYWFRQKKTIQQDSIPIEKSFEIVW